MAKHTDKTGRSKRPEQWTKLVGPMMETSAWKAPLPKAQALYPWPKFEWHGPQFNNNGNIQFSSRQASEAIGIGIDTATHAFRELQEKVFILNRNIRYRTLSAYSAVAVQLPERRR